jgi:hypothetical protein
MIVITISLTAIASGIIYIIKKRREIKKFFNGEFMKALRDKRLKKAFWLFVKSDLAKAIDMMVDMDLTEMMIFVKDIKNLLTRIVNKVEGSPTYGK